MLNLLIDDKKMRANFTIKQKTYNLMTNIYVCLLYKLKILKLLSNRNIKKERLSVYCLAVTERHFLIFSIEATL